MPETSRDKKTDTPEKLKVLKSGNTDLFSYTVSATKDSLKLLYEATPIDPPPEEPSGVISKKLILDSLPADVDKSLVDEGVIDTIVKFLLDGKSASQRRISKGTPSKPGRDGRIVLLVKKYDGGKSQDATDFIDPRFLRLFDNIEKNTVVARIYPPVEGQDGMDVFGKPIKCKSGTPCKTRHDKSIDLIAPEGRNAFSTLVANTAGYLIEDGNNLKIKHELILNCDIDYHTGDIYFIGDITVKGDVMTNFSVKARGDISITGSVSGGSLHSEAGSISVSGVISGSNSASLKSGDNVSSSMIDEMIGESKPRIYAAKSLDAAVIQGAEVDIGYSVSIQTELRDTSLRAGGTISIDKGHILGGQTMSACGVEAAIIGSKAGARTEIVLCSNVESTNEFIAVARDIRTHEEAADLLRLHLGPYANAEIERESTLKQAHRAMLMRLRKKLNDIKVSLEILEKKKDKLLEEAQYNSSFRVNVNQITYPGVIISAGEIEFALNDPLEGPKTIQFNTDTQSFETGDKKPLECDFEVDD